MYSAHRVPTVLSSAGQTPTVVEVHDLHVWLITSAQPALSAHVLVDPGTDCHATRLLVEDLLRHEYRLTIRRCKSTTSAPTCSCRSTPAPPTGTGPTPRAPYTAAASTSTDPPDHPCLGSGRYGMTAAWSCTP